jgi:hypothetical protein
MAAQAQVEKAKDEKDKPKREVSILYNGTERDFRYVPGHKVGELLAEAIAAFGVAANPHLLSLFDEAGRELAEADMLKAAGVGPGDELVLRPSAVKGG